MSNRHPACAILPLAVLITALSQGVAFPSAEAYVRMVTEPIPNLGQSVVPLRWTQSCIPLLPDRLPPPTLPLSDVQQVLSAAVGNWNRPTASCAALSLLVRQPAPRVARTDGLNVVIFVTGTWGRGSMVYDESAAALTTVAYVSRYGYPEHGTISDADIELNAVDFYFARLSPSDLAPREPEDLGGRYLADLENTLTHELGHVLGLGHTCWDHLGPQPLDDRNQLIPDCQDPLPASITTTTMYPYAAEGEISKRDITRDEVRGLCEPYPVTASLLTCENTVYGGLGCQLLLRRGTADPGGPATAAPLLLVGLCACRRRLTRLR